MAKQSGLHQIRGKVGEHSYYKQTGVSAGLIRSINQGLSARVKSGEEYANTRLNNSEFGAACNVAGLLGKAVVPKFRPMVLPFSQSKMAKMVLALAKNSAGSWGQRVIPAASSAELAAILQSTSKRDYKEFVTLNIEADETVNEYLLSYEISGEQNEYMKSLGIDHVQVLVCGYNIGTGKYNSSLRKITPGVIFRQFAESDTTNLPASGSVGDDISFTMLPYNPQAANLNGQQIVVAVIMPIRTINEQQHILQEYCSFAALTLPSA